MFLFCSSSFSTVLQLKFYEEYNIEEINLTVFNQTRFKEINHKGNSEMSSSECIKEVLNLQINEQFCKNIFLILPCQNYGHFPFMLTRPVMKCIFWCTQNALNSLLFICLNSFWSQSTELTVFITFYLASIAISHVLA